MARDLWNEDDDKEFSGEYVQKSGGDFPIIPHETRVKFTIDSAEWKFNETNYKNNKELEDCISLRFEIEDGEFAGQKIFKKLWIDSEKEELQAKDWKMFCAIDINAGGKIRALRRKPTDDDLSKYLINKSMVGVIGMMKDKETGKPSNYLMGVSSGKPQPSDKPAPKQQQAAKPSKPAATDYGSEDDSDNIPF